LRRETVDASERRRLTIYEQESLCMARAIVVMGVSGCGETTIGARPAPGFVCLGNCRLVADAPRGPLPTQLVHGDFQSANVLCAGSDVAAVIDFEEARPDSRVVELARSAVMLGTRFRDWGPVSAEVRAGFLDGYQSELQLTPAEVHWWDVLVHWYSLLLVPAGDDPTGWGSETLSQLRKVGEDA
jgi:homoserine kinase type II